jgi:hypothetical protein
MLGIHAPKGWSQLPIPYKLSNEMSAEQRAHLVAAMNIWEKAAGKKLFAYVGLDSKKGDDFKDLYSSLNDTTNGHYLDTNWKKTGKADYVLATTIWTNGASSEVMLQSDIRFNNECYLFGDSLKLDGEPAREIVDLQSLALHELGHLLGLGHITEEQDDDSIMNPALFIGKGLTSRTLSKGDFERIHAIYGCKGKACDIEAMVEDMNYHPQTSFTDPVTKEVFTSASSEQNETP